MLLFFNTLPSRHILNYTVLNMKISLEDKPWWNYIEHDLQGLLKQSLRLIEEVGDWKKRFHDYSFIVFPSAKAYEGFLKKLFLDMEFIDENDYYGKRFRIGKALNPALKGKLRKRVSVYDKIVGYCGGTELAKTLWNTWKTCRNLLFHWFPSEKNAISFAEAKKRVEKVIATFDLAFGECMINTNNPITQFPIIQ